jgi:hypothetical protein
MASSIDTTVPLPFELPPLPETVNHTPWPAQNFLHVDPAGDVFHVMVCRTSYSLRDMPTNEAGLMQPVLLPPEEQTQLVAQDQYRGELNSSSVVQESDFAPYKPLCDVVLSNAVACAPRNEPAARWAVGFRFGDAFSKVLNVTGPRYYERSLTSLGTLQLSEPEPALRVPICYELAYGGPNLVSAYAQADQEGTEPEQRKLPAFYTPNPIGVGRWGGKDTRTWIEAQSEQMLKAHNQAPDLRDPQHLLTDNFDAQVRYRGPQIEPQDQSFNGGDKDFPVVGYGPVSRWWQPRHQLAGTHDAQWKATQWPKSPKDHDYRYWNFAPEDQQIAYPEGGEEITLANLTPATPLSEGAEAASAKMVHLALPKQPLQVLARLQAGPQMMIPMNIDTVVIDFTMLTLHIVRRALIPADLDVRKLELGTWEQGEYSDMAIPVLGSQPRQPQTI